MSTDKVFTIDELRECVNPLVKKYNLKGASLFGSYARGEADSASDIDLIVYRGDNAKYLAVYGMAENLRELTGKEVDAFEISEIAPGPFRDDILREAIAP